MGRVLRNTLGHIVASSVSGGDIRAGVIGLDSSHGGAMEPPNKPTPPHPPAAGRRVAHDNQHREPI